MVRLFGTDGVRGEAGVYPLDKATVSKIGRSMAARLSERLGRPPLILTGRDTRDSGPSIERAFTSGAATGGGRCRSAAVITTPGVAFLTRSMGFDLGVVISASHNPYYDNGIKAFLPSGQKLDEEMERQIEADISDNDLCDEVSAGSTIDESDQGEMRAAYLEHLLEQAHGLQLDGFRIAIDCANGAASNLATLLFQDLGAEVAAFHDRPDGKNINDRCGSLFIEQFRSKVVAVNADIGIAFDGDADRALFIDERGELVDGDATLWIMAGAMQRSGELASGKVVATVMSNIGLELALETRDIEMVRTAVGDKYVLEELLRAGIELGGEQSGHIIFPHQSLVGDGMMTAIRVVRAVVETGQPLSRLTDGFRRYPQVLVNVKVARKPPFEEVEAIRTAVSGVEASLNGGGRLLLRYSGTENLARVMIEGPDQSRIEDLANGLAETIKIELN